MSTDDSIDALIAKVASNEGVSPLRVKKAIAFDRFLARLLKAFPDGTFLLKGGYALELRYRGRARPAEDLDFSIPSGHRVEYGNFPKPDEVTNIDLGDGFDFRFDSIENFSCGDDPSTLYGRARYYVECRRSGVSFFEFHVDTDLGDISFPEPDCLFGWVALPNRRDSPIQYPGVSLETQFAEKMHAYTNPERWKVRPAWKDLLDMVLICHESSPDISTLATGIQVTFDRRFTHAPKVELDKPEDSWTDEFNKYVKDTPLTGMGLSEAFSVLEKKVEGDLRSTAGGCWAVAPSRCNWPPGLFPIASPQSTISDAN